MKHYKELRVRLTLEDKSLLGTLAQLKLMSQAALVRHLIQVEARKYIRRMIKLKARGDSQWTSPSSNLIDEQRV